MSEAIRTVYVDWGTELRFPHRDVFGWGENEVDRQIDGLESIGFPQPIRAASYSIMETTTVDNGVGGASLRDRPRQDMSVVPESLPVDDFPIDRRLLESVRPPLRESTIDIMLEGLSAAGIRSCADVLEAGHVGIAIPGTFGPDRAALAALTKHLTGREVTLHGEAAS